MVPEIERIVVNDKDRQRRVEKAQMRVLFNVPFFAPGVARLPVVFTEDPAIPTAATDGEKVIWNKSWFDSLPDAVIPTVLCHEVAHCLLGHNWRAPAGCDWQTWNEATDHAVNTMLKEWSAIVMKGNVADPFPFPDPPEAYLANPAFTGMAEEKIYSCLANKPKGGQPGGNPGGSGSGSGSGSQPGQPGQGKPGQKPGPNSMPGFGQIQKPATGNPAAQQKQKSLANDWQNTFNVSAALGKGRGTMPGCIEQMIDRILHPSVPWFELVRQWLREKANDDWNWSKPNPFYDDGEFILPVLDSERMGTIVFATDTSGSIDMDAHAHFVSEKQNCLDDLRPSKLIDIQCDTRINQVTEYRQGDVIDPTVKGGGGTSFEPVFEHCETLTEVPKCLVYLTDLDGRFPDKAPEYPVLWVTWDKKKQVPFGDVITVE